MNSKLKWVIFGCLAVLAGKLVQADEQGSSIKSAKIEVLNVPAIPLVEGEDWRKAPDFLAHATIYFSPELPSSVLKFSVAEPGVVVLAASFSYDSDQMDEPWTDDCQTFADLKKDGWTVIGVLNSPKTSRHYLFRKVVKAGEKYQLQTRLRFPPYVILVPDADASAVMSVKPWVGPERNTPMVLAPEEYEPKGQAPGASPQIVSLKFHDPEPSVLHPRIGILLREIVQQGVSLAASEHLGLPTRDTSLRDSLSQDSQPGIGPLQVVTIAQPLYSVDIAIYQQRGKAWEVLWDAALRLPPKDLYENLTTVVEKLSRSEFVDMLHHGGYEGTPPPAARESAPLPDGVDKMLAELTMPAQFGAIRLLHCEIRKNGQSPELVGALARGYAMLGVLTEVLWSPAHKVFKARALLLAERAVQAWPTSAPALEHRAYVRALIGLHRTALDDLAAASALRKASETDQPAPAAWTKAIEAFCKFDDDALQSAAKEESNTTFVRLLQLLTAEYSQSERDILNTSGELLQAAPGCLRAVDAATRVRQLGAFRMSVDYGIELAQRDLLAQVAVVPDLPTEASKLIVELQKARKTSGLARFLGAKPPDEMAVRLKVIDALREAGAPEHDPAQPSWQVLAQLLEEIDFLQAWWQVDVSALRLGLPGNETDTVIASVLPTVEHHPYAQLIASFQSDPDKSKAALQHLLETIDTSTIQYRESRIISRLDSISPNWGTTHWPLGLCSEDVVAPDVCGIISNTQSPQREAMALSSVSPHMPFAVASAIAHDANDARSRMGELEKQYAKSALVLAALGKQYYKSQKFDDGIRCFQAAIALEPSYTSYWYLAAIYQQKGDEDKWLATLEEFLKTESLGLEHAHVQVQIANYFMEKRDWQKARGYAEEAAQSWAGWAMICAAKCAEALQDWTVAEQWYQATSERYESSACEWFEFCKRTGQGDQQKALDLAMTYVRKTEKSNSMKQLWQAGEIRALANQPQEALQDYEKALSVSYSPEIALITALMFDELGQPERRDQILNNVHKRRDKYEKNVSATLALCELIREEFAAGSEPKIDFDALEKIVNLLPPGPRSCLLYPAGRYVDQHGYPEKAIEYWNAAMDSIYINLFPRTMAGAALWDRGITPASYKDALWRKPEKTSPESGK